jgi:hypothetical protein
MNRATARRDEMPLPWAVIGSIDESLFLTLPTLGLTGPQIMSSHGLGASSALSAAPVRKLGAVG